MLAAAGTVFAAAGTVFAAAGTVFAAAGTVFAAAGTVFAAAGTVFAAAGRGSGSARGPDGPGGIVCVSGRGRLPGHPPAPSPDSRPSLTVPSGSAGDRPPQRRIPRPAGPGSPAASPPHP
ncbi:hypothetical protein [Amycolatopsis viridis]|uniref:Uncharacterized protein n=1 Tax=Amycolatopsis viridis TaxID=185678 RepID=A0ABX0SX81_9PSEU|nr:hypothetical protein [Amycolatopsis viridis]NIH81009.1 hypothetical protein [Amycolatopsis viridis]